ncbi:class I SAM-dependent methyltransferase [Tetragenococcus halophilus]|uniref:class I SAM-dependent methyltransferase n=1 Tax=Tetragenococcus halophilus TaxID=51669 RepID=UPI0012FE0FC9|nr:class I SAM-dependent methyltransferase [Tetragenococcus halophilus]NWN99217.1 methyltransferase domain-containing protein [Tetragenococcus halophilus]QXN87856.1 class I SAM-dependent methyltransferase [Tetragenococcus halophilus]WJS80900.1 methyltransferase domain-containing protein [Tetragenococcus halophilus]GFK24325.1 methylase for ubiquinone/menaquinone biosynthesis [Tetragenococcus halophilus]
MQEKLKEIKQFWDDFAREYTDIQEESQLTIQKDVLDFFKKQGILPQNNLLDLAGGSGKYIPFFISQLQNYVLVDLSSEMLKLASNKYPYNNLNLIESSQQSFLQQTKDHTFDIVFSAMNPALTLQTQLKEMIRVARKYVCILRLVKEEDQLFSPIEERLYGKAEHLAWMSTYKSWFENAYQSKTFHYATSETISKHFFYLYFKDELANDELEKAIERLFQGKKEVENTTYYTFELLYCRLEKQKAE